MAEKNPDIVLTSYSQSFLNFVVSRIDFKGKTVLEIGCGNGNLAKTIARDYYPKFIYGIEPGLDWWWQTVENEGERFSIRDGNGESIQFPDNYFDVVISLAVFEHIPNPEKCLSEIKRVLKIGGEFITSFAPVWSSIVGHHWHHWDHEILKIPPWGHLYMTYDEMYNYLLQESPHIDNEEKNTQNMYYNEVDAQNKINEESAKKICDFIYKNDIINRIDCRRFETAFHACGMKIISLDKYVIKNRLTWVTGTNFEDELTDEIRAKLSGQYTEDELYTASFHVHLINDGLSSLPISNQCGIRQKILGNIFSLDEKLFSVLQKNSEDKQETMIDASQVLQRMGDAAKIECYLKYLLSNTNKSGSQKKDCVKIAMFTPLSPIKSGISEYAQEMLMELKEFFQIELFIDDDYMPDAPEILKYFPIKRHSEYPALSENYDLVVYQFGNNLYHVYMMNYILKYPGVVVVHDTNIAFLQYENLFFQEHAGISGKLTMKHILDRSLGVIVHNEYAKALLQKQNYILPIYKANLYADTNMSKVSEAELRQRLGIYEDEIIIASFGFVTKHKYIDKSLKAFSKLLTHFPDKKIRYMIVGEGNKEDCKNIRREIRDLGIKRSVVLTGYVREDIFYDYIHASDICVNLRSHYSGESSSIVTRIMGCGKPCIVNNIGFFAELPSEACVKITTDECDIEDELLERMIRLVADSDLRKRIGDHAQRYAMDQLNIKKIADGIKNFLIYIYQSNPDNRTRLVDALSKFICYNCFRDIEYTFDYACAYLSNLWSTEGLTR